VVTDPYDDDDDAPTLQRHSPASGSGPIAPQSGPAARFVSGFRAAYTPLGESAEGDESDFPIEADTAADGIPLASLLSDDVIELIEDEVESEIELAETVTALPADLERDTVLLPVDVAALLQRASAKTDDDDGT